MWRYFNFKEVYQIYKSFISLCSEIFTETCCHVLVTILGVWIANWIYWTLIYFKYKELQHYR
jgi:hypothetical protein